ncbi:MAG: isoleucine--tRNA ligase [Alphaproteobacteria bacterium]|nr:isoleucine--tRNA ligase [Alphaproteobacteria bacterium]
MAYPKTDPRADFSALEQEVLKYWRENNTFQNTLDKTESGAPFSFYDGPPFANGLPHWGHLGVSVVKDMVARFQTMSGRHVVRELGWDCHGLPAENSVEIKQGRSAKDIVANDGIVAFCDMCRTDVMTYTNEWGVFIERMGRWVKIGDEYGYKTMNRNYMESMLWTLKSLYEKGLLYKDYSVNPYDWVNGTVVSNSEASQDYREIVDDAVTVWFELENGDRAIAWTTTPWTLPANSALAVNPNMEYLRMQDSDGAVYIIAASRLKAYEKQFANATEIGRVKGSELAGLHYAPLFPYYAGQSDLLFQIIPADYVSDGDGTGIVHIAPAYGAEDFWAAKNIDPKFPVLLNVDTYGNFDETVVDFAGENIFAATPKIMDWLKQNGKLVKKEQYKHSYPFGDRSKEKLIQRATDSWYIDVPKIKDKLLANNAKVNWTSAGERFRSWIENARPWSISRNRFWGMPLPIWERDGEFKVFGSIAELEEFFGVEVKDLHRPTLDKLTRDGWTRISDVLDCWVESGSMPWASLHYPFENVDKFNATFPADYIIEGQDQTRGWFYALMVLATALFDKPAFMTVSANGMVVDENKKKFSKSLKNFVNPSDQIEQYGADAVRLFILGSNFMKAEPVPVDKEGKVFAESTKTIQTPLWNAYHFFTLYANAGNVTAQEITDSDNALDKYIMAELNVLTDAVKDALTEYKPDAAIKEFVRFLDILNNWYIRRGRARFWDEEQTAFDTLYTVLVSLCRLLAPFAPFVSEYIYRALTGGESVHLTDFPTASAPDMQIVSDMRRVQSVVSTGKQLREKYGLRNRLPLRGMIVAGADLSRYTDIIQEELNVKSVKFESNTDNVADSFVYLITPKIGARLGGALKDIIPSVKRGDYELVGDKLLAAGHELNADEFENRLTVRDGVSGAALPDNTAVVVLDTDVDASLVAEGLANDALRFIQDTRKAVNLDVSDRIVLTYAADPALANAIEQHKKRIMREALITQMVTGDGEYTTEFEGYNLAISINKA